MGQNAKADWLDAADSGGGMADDRAKTGAWKGSNSPRWAGLVPSIEAPSSMDGTGFVKGWTCVRQWIEQRDSMDGTMRFNGWNKSFQWIDNRLSITGVSASHFSRKVGSLALAKCESGGGWTRRIPATEWWNEGNRRG